jgi:hypothetical protein
LHGEDEEIELSGQELAILIKSVPTGGCRVMRNGVPVGSSAKNCRRLKRFDFSEMQKALALASTFLLPRLSLLRKAFFCMELSGAFVGKNLIQSDKAELPRQFS